jgi:hypothetical protein
MATNSPIRSRKGTPARPLARLGRDRSVEQLSQTPRKDFGTGAGTVGSVTPGWKAPGSTSLLTEMAQDMTTDTPIASNESATLVAKKTVSAANSKSTPKTTNATSRSIITSPRATSSLSNRAAGLTAIKNMSPFASPPKSYPDRSSAGDASGKEDLKNRRKTLSTPPAILRKEIQVDSPAINERNFTMKTTKKGGRDQPRVRWADGHHAKSKGKKTPPKKLYPDVKESEPTVFRENLYADGNSAVMQNDGDIEMQETGDDTDEPLSVMSSVQLYPKLKVPSLADSRKDTALRSRKDFKKVSQTEVEVNLTVKASRVSAPMTPVDDIPVRITRSAARKLRGETPRAGEEQQLDSPGVASKASRKK